MSIFSEYGMADKSIYRLMYIDISVDMWNGAYVYI